MKKILSIATALAALCGFAANDMLTIYGRVKDAVTKADIRTAYVYRLDSAGIPVDSALSNRGLTFNDGVIDTLSMFFMSVPRTDSLCMLEFRCEGYKPLLLPYDISNVGRREESRSLETIFLDRAPVALHDVTVTSTKIKFYNKGDTVVYNADAFQLAEGSMLDALIAQLPGAELNTDGQIKINGQFVESLLLNGKEFMDGNNNVMLENIAAYTVKDIQVYEGQKVADRLRGDLLAPKVLTMDVRLKKEFSMGWLINAQAGYGTEDRYLAKLFANMFTNTSRVSLIGNVNNLNDNRRPGRNDTWTPEQMPAGRKEYRMAGLDYNFSDAREMKVASGSVAFAQSVNNDFRSTSQTNFLPGGDTYDRSFVNSRLREISLKTDHDFYLRTPTTSKSLSIGGSYRYGKNNSSGLSATFDRELQNLTMEVLEGLYAGSPSEALEAVINRNRTRTDGWSRSWAFNVSPYFAFKLPKSNDRLYVSVYAQLKGSKEDLWRDYDVNYGQNPTAAVRRRQYVDNSPNRTVTLGGATGYRGSFGNWNAGLTYHYSFEDKTADSYLYALERLEDMGIYGVVPEDYLSALDPGNSHRTRLYTNTHSFNPQIAYYKRSERNFLTLQFSPTVSLIHRKINYWTDNRDYRLSRQNTTVDIGNIWIGRIEGGFGGQMVDGRTDYRHYLRYSYRIQYTLPELVDMLDVMSDYDPLNVYLGNPDLKAQVTHRHLVRWQYSPKSFRFYNILYLGATHTSNTLVRGYTYDTSTGVRVNRMYNVDGDRTLAVTDELNWQFGAQKQFTLSSETDASFSRYNDMIGVNKSEPEPFKVNYRSLSEKFKFGWQFVGQSLTLRCDYTNRRTTSKREGFDTQNAHHINYGISGVFTLPAGFGISTDFICYTRRGYGVSYLDTTDPVWNVRLSYCPPRHNRWVFMADGFDLLHKLSNVSYAVTATGRTVTYTNSLPRYLMFSVQYRLSLQPKK